MDSTLGLGIGSRVDHTHFGKGVVVDIGSEFYTIWFKSQNAAKNVSHDFTGLRVLDGVDAGAATGGNSLTIADIEEALEKILERRLNEFQLVPMANKWNDGLLILKPADDSLQTKELPIEAFFHKIVMVRDRLRLIEQKINASKLLNDGEKVELQQYVTAIYGSLTTFNVLFRDQHHQFKGTGG